MIQTQDSEIRTQGQEIRQLSTVVIRHEDALISDNWKWKPEVLQNGQSCIILNLWD